MSCSTTTTTTCQGNLYCDLGCTIELDSCCVYYSGPNLLQIKAYTGDSIDQIIETIEDLDLHPTQFMANSTNSIFASTGGALGHSPTYQVRRNPSAANILLITPAGLYVDSGASSDGLVSIDGTDVKDYLKNKFAAASDADHIMTVWPVDVAGQIELQPSLNMSNLLTTIGNSFSDLWCALFGGCGGQKKTRTTSTTTTTTAGGPTISSSSTTTTTTQAPGPTTSTSSTTTTTNSSSSTTTTTTNQIFDTTFNFISNAQATGFGVIATIATTDNTTRFSFNKITSPTGFGANMDINVAALGGLFMVVSFPTDYIGLNFKLIDSNGVSHFGTFTNGTINF